MSTEQEPRASTEPSPAAGARRPSGPNVALLLVLVAVVALSLLALVLKQAY